MKFFKVDDQNQVEEYFLRYLKDEDTLKELEKETDIMNYLVTKTIKSYFILQFGNRSHAHLSKEYKQHCRKLIKIIEKNHRVLELKYYKDCESIAQKYYNNEKGE